MGRAAMVGGGRGMIMVESFMWKVGMHTKHFNIGWFHLIGLS